MKVKCPGPDYPCGITWERAYRQSTKTFRGEIQHHLYMRHKMDVIESHKLADKVVEQCEKNSE